MWTEADLFRDCAVKHSDIAPNQALGEHTYAAVWSALRAWLLALFNRCRGGVFPTFARIAWHRVGGQLEDGVPMLRPIFVPSDAYLRAHLLHTGSGVTRASSVGASDLEPCEEYSAMKIAIKHSCSLNKDVVSSCTRHLLHHLGEALRSGQALSLDLGVGILTGRDRCLAFRFHSHYLAHWPAAAAAAALAAERSAAAAALPPPPHERRLAKSDGGRTERGGRAAGQRPGSAGGSLLTLEGDVGGGPDMERQQQAAGGGAGAFVRPSSPGRRGCFAAHPGTAQLQQEDEPGAGQQRLSPGRGEDPEQRQPGRAAVPPPGPPSPARSRPGWGVRVPPPPPSPGRRAAATAAPHSPGPYSSRGPALGAPDAPASPGCHYHQRPHQLSCESSEGMPYSPRVSGNGGDEVMGGAMPVGRALHLATRTPRRRPSSPGSAPHHPPPNSSSHRPYGRAAHSNSEGGASMIPGARPSSAPRSRPVTAAVAAGAAAVSAEAAALAAPGRQAQPTSPRLGGGATAAAAVSRPPWGSGHGARGRSASAAGAGGAIRPSSAPRLRYEAAATAAAASVGAAAATEGDAQQGPRIAWAAAGGGSGVSGGGGAAIGMDVRQLWSPDSNLAAARRGPNAAAGASSVRRLFGGGESQARHSNLPQQQQQRHPEVGVMQQPQRQRQQPRAAANNSRNAGATGSDDGHENDDDAVFDQQKHPPPSHQQHQQQQRNAGQSQEKQQQQLRHGARKPLFLTPQKDAARPAAAAGPGRPAGCSLLKSPPGGNGGGAGGQQRPAAAREPQRGSFGGDEPPDHSPQLRRDQCSKQPATGSPRMPRREPAQAAAPAAGYSRPQRSLVRALSPRTETQQLNMRYGTPTRAGGGQAAAVVLDCAAIHTEQAGGAMADAGRGAADADPTGRALGVLAAAGAVLGDGREGARLPARPNLVGICGAAFGSPAAAGTAAGAAGWDCDAPLTAGARQTEAIPGPLPGSSSRQGVGRALLPRDGLFVAAARDGEAVTRGPQPLQGTAAEAGRRHAATDAGFRCGGGSSSSSDGSLVLTGRSRGEESCRASGATATAASMALSFLRNSSSGGGGAGGDLGSSTCCVAPSIENLDLGYPLPLYDSSIDGDRSSSGGGSGPGSITAAVQAALGRQRRSGGGGGGPDLLRQTELQLVNVNLGASPRGADRYGERYGDAFPVPMIISEEDLPRPAWGAASVRPEPWQPGGSDSTASSAAGGPRSAAGGLGDGTVAAAAAELRGEEEGSHLEPVLVACSAASSAEICWSARSARQGYGADADAFGVGAGVSVGAAQRHRRACGGAPAGSADLGGRASLAGDCRRGAAVRASSSGSAGDGDEGWQVDNGCLAAGGAGASSLEDKDAGRRRSYVDSDESDSDVISGGGQRRRRGVDPAASRPQPLVRGGGRSAAGAPRGAIDARGCYAGCGSRRPGRGYGEGPVESLGDSGSSPLLGSRCEHGGDNGSDDGGRREDGYWNGFDGLDMEAGATAEEDSGGGGRGRTGGAGAAGAARLGTSDSDESDGGAHGGAADADALLRRDQAHPNHRRLMATAAARAARAWA